MKSRGKPPTMVGFAALLCVVGAVFFSASVAIYEAASLLSRWLP